MSTGKKLDKQDANKPKRDEKGRLLPGGTANPNGRPAGKTIKESVKEWLKDNPDDMKAFVEHFVKKNKELAWQMLEGRPPQDIKTESELRIVEAPSEVVKKINESNSKTSTSN